METAKCAQVSRVLGRVLYGLAIMAFGVMHFVNGAGMNGLVPSYLPGPTFWVYFTGVILLLGGLSVVIGKCVKSALVLGLTLLAFALLIHLPGVMNSETMMTSLPSFLKDSALAGFAFYFAGSCKEACKDGDSKCC